MLGPLFFIILFFLIVVSVKKLVVIATKRCESQNCFLNRIRKKIDYSIIISRFLLEGCLEIGISAIICTLMVEKENFDYVWEAISTVSAFLSILCLVIVPFYFVFITRRYLNELKSQPGAKSEYTNLFSDYKIQKWSLLYRSFFFLRRYCLLGVLALLNFHAYMQIHLQMASTLLMIAYIARVRPYVSPLDNLQELINELLAMLAAYPLLVFTSYEWSQKYRINIAWILLSFITVLVLFNIVIYCYAIIKWIKLKCRICHAKKKAK